MSQLFIGNKVASRRHSKIYHGIYKQREVAIKMISQPEEDETLAASLERQFASEVALLFRLRHPNIMIFVAACKKPPVFCIITEHMAGGSLRKYLHKQELHSLPLKLKISPRHCTWNDLSSFSGNSSPGFEVSKHFACGKMSVKVADFGISCLESQCVTRKGFMSTYWWMAPEMIKEKHHTSKVDVYSYGIVLWELLTALTPFQDMTPEQAAYLVAQKNERPSLPPSCPMAVSHLINQCWATNPDKRPQFEEIVSMLESYSKSIEEDPSFFSLYKTVQEQPLVGCFPRRFAIRRSASLSIA